MPTTLTPEFLTKKEACRTYDRSHRQLTRDLGAAMVSGDEALRSNFKIRTEDGEVIDGSEITTDLITKLRADGRNPIWYVRAEWMEKSFGRRAREMNESEEEQMPPATAESIHEDTAGNADEIVLLLKEQIRKLEDDKKDLQDDKKALREELKQRHEHALQTNVLMQDLHRLIAHMQTGLIPERTTSENKDSLKDPIEIRQVQTEEGITASTKRASRKANPASRRSARRTSDNSAIPKKGYAQVPKRVQNQPRFWNRDLREILSFRRK